ncbi:DUF3343 domain-containing protein [Lachnospiraceae bacterium 62-35]
MKRKENRVVISFHTTTEAIAMEEACREERIDGRLIPLPRVISAGCGLAWSAPSEKEQEILKFMKKRGLTCETTGIYLI